MLFLALEDGAADDWALEAAAEDVLEGARADYLLGSDEGKFGPLSEDVCCHPVGVGVDARPILLAVLGELAQIGLGTAALHDEVIPCPQDLSPEPDALRLVLDGQCLDHLIEMEGVSLPDRYPCLLQRLVLLHEVRPQVSTVVFQLLKASIDVGSSSHVGLVIFITVYFLHQLLVAEWFPEVEFVCAEEVGEHLEIGQSFQFGLALDFSTD